MTHLVDHDPNHGSRPICPKCHNTRYIKQYRTVWKTKVKNGKKVRYKTRALVEVLCPACRGRSSHSRKW